MPKYAIPPHTEAELLRNPHDMFTHRYTRFITTVSRLMEGTVFGFLILHMALSYEKEIRDF